MDLRAAALSDVALLRYWDTKPQVIAASGDDGDIDLQTELPRRRDWRG